MGIYRTRYESDLFKGADFFDPELDKFRRKPGSPDHQDITQIQKKVADWFLAGAHAIYAAY